MVSDMERRKHARSKHPAGSVSRYAQQRVDERVKGVMAHRQAAAARHREAHSGQPLPRDAADARPVTPDA